MTYDIVTLGECLIDFTPFGKSEAGQLLYERNPGGAPVNVAAALSKLGKKTAFIGKVGSDPLGVYLIDALQANGVSAQGVVTTPLAHTTMAFVNLDKNGDRSFHFCRQPGADQLLEYGEVDPLLLKNATVFHFGSISMSSEPGCDTTLQAVRTAKKHGATITYDPNWRPSLWSNETYAKAVIQSGMCLADIVKVSEEELVFLMEDLDIASAAEKLMNEYPIQLLLVTAGANGSYYRTEKSQGWVESFEVNAVDTTGAGDGFLGAFLYQLLEHGKRVTHWTETELREAVSFANAAGALATTRKGAIPSLAVLSEINGIMAINSETDRGEQP